MHMQIDVVEHLAASVPFMQVFNVYHAKSFVISQAQEKEKQAK